MSDGEKWGYSLLIPEKLAKELAVAVEKERAKAEKAEQPYKIPFLSLEVSEGVPARLLVMGGVVLPVLGLIDSFAEQLHEEPILLS